MAVEKVRHLVVNTHVLLPENLLWVLKLAELVRIPLNLLSALVMP
jgi:hypothetical protein